MASQDICFIPARAGSQRVRDKNAIKLDGRNLVEIAIEQAQLSKLFSEIHFSSDDEGLLKCAKAMGVKTFRRPSELAGNQIGLIAVIQQHLKHLNLAPLDSLCLFLATNALRLAEDVRQGYVLFQQHDRKMPVISVVMNEHPIELCFKPVDGFLESYLGKELATTRKQDFPPTYFWNDAFLIDNASNWLKEGRLLYPARMVPYIMPPERSIAIDYPFQVAITQALYNPESE